MSNVVDIRSRKPAAPIPQAPAAGADYLNAERLAGLRSIEQRHADAMAAEINRITAKHVEHLARMIGIEATREVCLRTLSRLQRGGRAVSAKVETAVSALKLGSEVFVTSWNYREVFGLWTVCGTYERGQVMCRDGIKVRVFRQRDHRFFTEEDVGAGTWTGTGKERSPPPGRPASPRPGSAA